MSVHVNLDYGRRILEPINHPNCTTEEIERSLRGYWEQFKGVRFEEIGCAVCGRKHGEKAIAVSIYNSRGYWDGIGIIPVCKDCYTSTKLIIAEVKAEYIVTSSPYGFGQYTEN